MLFEAWQDGTCKMATDHESCIPPLEQLRDMKKAGFTFRRDGKAWKLPAEKGKRKEKENG